MTPRIAIIDTDACRAAALEKLVSEAGYAEVLRIAHGPNMANMVQQVAPDLVIIDMALPDRDALEDIRCLTGKSAVVMFCESNDADFVSEAIAAGVCSYSLPGVAGREVKAIVTAAIALFNRYRQVESKLATAEALLDERRQIERAKAILMKNGRMSEPDAYRWLQKKAMNESRKLSHVVADFVAQSQKEKATERETES